MLVTLQTVVDVKRDVLSFPNVFGNRFQLDFTGKAYDELSIYDLQLQLCCQIGNTS
jgi:hypothetical protein